MTPHAAHPSSLFYRRAGMATQHHSRARHATPGHPVLSSDRCGTPHYPTVLAECCVWQRIFLAGVLHCIYLQSGIGGITTVVSMYLGWCWDHSCSLAFTVRLCLFAKHCVWPKCHGILHWPIVLADVISDLLWNCSTKQQPEKPYWINTIGAVAVSQPPPSNISKLIIAANLPDCDACYSTWGLCAAEASAVADSSLQAAKHRLQFGITSFTVFDKVWGGLTHDGGWL